MSLIYHFYYIFTFSLLISIPLIGKLHFKSKFSKITLALALNFLIFSFVWQAPNPIIIETGLTSEGVYSCKSSTRSGMGIILKIGQHSYYNSYSYNSGFWISCDKELNNTYVNIEFARFHEARDNEKFDFIAKITTSDQKVIQSNKRSMELIDEGHANGARLKKLTLYLSMLLLTLSIALFIFKK
jgi:hypothetical protein